MRNCLRPFVAFSVLAVTFGATLSAAEIALTAAADPYQADVEGSAPVRDRNAQKRPMKITAHPYAHGLGVQVNTTLAIAVNGARRFRAQVGVDDAAAAGTSVAFAVVVDGKPVLRRVLAVGAPPEPINVDLAGHKTLVLISEDVGNARTQTPADWVDAVLEYDGAPPAAMPVLGVEDEAPYILTPPAPPTPRINGARIFGVRPGHPFLFTVPATGERPMRFTATGLPSGLVLDAGSGRITGVLRASGEFVVHLKASNARGDDTNVLRIICGDVLALTPPMGWNSWNCWGDKVDQDKVLRSAQAMVSRGLVNHGWTYVNIDDTWQGARPAPTHALQPNEKFPDLKRLCDDIHALGLKAGIYSTPWVASYENYPGGSAENPTGAWTKFPGHYKAEYSGKTLPFAIGRYSFAGVDAQQYAAWGIDYLKYDWDPNELPETREMAEALNRCDRDIVYSVSNEAPLRNAAGLSQLANAWRTTEDIRDTWVSIIKLGLAQEPWRAWAKPGHWNDPDMLVIGRVGGPWRHGLEPTRLTPTEQYTHITFWSLLSAPLLIGCPLDDLDAFTLNLLTNDEVLAIDQDELGSQAAQKIVDGRRQIWVKELADGSRAIGLLNLASDAQEIGFTWTQLGLPAPRRVRDPWRQQDLPADASGFAARVPRHGMMLVRAWSAAP